MPNQPRPGNPARALRVENELWQAAKVKAKENGETVSDVLRRCLQTYVEES